QNQFKNFDSVTEISDFYNAELVEAQIPKQWRGYIYRRITAIVFQIFKSISVPFSIFHLPFCFY
ncbi:MAG: hypothetical protein V4546_12440, partial [Bacteroidota bacterium]